ncbi:MAG: OmpA family protein [Desulfobacterales bacterium]|nr:OmpA family protein [Desulfobacterales bacterium]
MFPHKAKTNSFPNEDNPFAFSIGDLMSALLLIFVLLLSGTMLQLKKQLEIEKVDMEKSKTEHKKKADLAQKYRELQNHLYEDLKSEFEKDLSKWDAILDKKNLSIRFKEPEVLFESGKSSVKLKFKEILNDFFPRYINLLYEKHKITIEEIRIEGHTSSEWSEQCSKEEAYFNNMKLSQDRTRTVLEFVLNTIKNNDLKIQEWARGNITANGLSYSKSILNSEGYEDKDASRRVEFRVRTDAEKQISEIIESWEEK